MLGEVAGGELHGVLGRRRKSRPCDHPASGSRIPGSRGSGCWPGPRRQSQCSTRRPGPPNTVAAATAATRTPAATSSRKSQPSAAHEDSRGVGAAVSGSVAAPLVKRRSPLLPGAYSGIPAAQRGQVADPARRSGGRAPRATGADRSRPVVGESGPPSTADRWTRTTHSTISPPAPPPRAPSPARAAGRQDVVDEEDALAGRSGSLAGTRAGWRRRRRGPPPRRSPGSPSWRPVSNARMTPPVVGPATRSTAGAVVRRGRGGPRSRTARSSRPGSWSTANFSSRRRSGGRS